MRVLLLSILFALLAGVRVSPGQQHCVEGLRSGAYNFVRSNSAASDSSTIHNEMCSAYSRYKSEDQAGAAKVSYGLFDGSVNFSREQIDALGQMLCKSDYSDSSVEKVTTYASAAISPEAMVAYQQCLKMSEKGLRVEISLRDDDRGVIAMTLSYLTGRRDYPKVTGIQLDPVEEFSCSGTLFDAATAASRTSPLELDQAMSMLCRRTIHQTPVLVGTRAVLARPATILVETQEDAIRYHLPSVRVDPGPDELEKLRKQILPVGSYVLATSCPSEYFLDVTDKLSGNLVGLSASVSGSPAVSGGDGSHGHGGGEHTHPVSGSTLPVNNGGERSGTQPQRHAVHMHMRRPIEGTAAATSHSHSGGAHSHSTVSFRLCQKIAGAMVSGGS